MHVIIQPDKMSVAHGLQIIRLLNIHLNKTTKQQDYKINTCNCRGPMIGKICWIFAMAFFFESLAMFVLSYIHIVEGFYPW